MMCQIFIYQKIDMKTSECTQCNQEIHKDVRALNKKLLGHLKESTLCLECLADFLGATTDDLLIKIEEFKEQGCDLFK